MVKMIILKVTPVRNVLIGKKCFKSERPDMFINKVIDQDTKLEIFDVSSRKLKTVNSNEINKRYHRMIINNKKYFICSINAG
jgi:hypothetical protein